MDDHGGNVIKDLNTDFDRVDWTVFAVGIVNSPILCVGVAGVEWGLFSLLLHQGFLALSEARCVRLISLAVFVFPHEVVVGVLGDV